MDESRKAYLKKYRKTYKDKVKRVNLTFSNTEYRKIYRTAKADNMKVATFIKQLTLRTVNNEPHIPSTIHDELKTLRFAVLNIANNINQIAHHSNTIHNLTQAEENNLLQYLKQLDEVIRSYTSGRLLDEDVSHDN